MSDALRLVLLGDERLSCELPESGMLVVGQSAERAGFVVEGQGVDDAHFAIGRTKNGGWAVKDLGSQYGTMLNGARVRSARLQAGDKLLAGSRRFEVCEPGQEPVAEAPPEEQPGNAPEPAARPKKDAPRKGEVDKKRRPKDMPERIGGYRIDRLLGRGGAGKVYLALQESLSRPVALKILAPKYASDAKFIERFQSEARAAAALSHPNVVVVHDVGEAEGRHYLSMEFMPGGSLEQRLSAAGPLPWRQVLDVLADAAAGLMYAESRGIVHRDIKPANLMLTGAGTVKIADLGLATSSEAESEAEVGSDGRKIVGTPHFMSPEQARAERVDHRSDLYSLGATAYRLLSGHTPFEGDTTRDILRALLTEDPIPVREYVEGLPDDLENLIAKLLSKAPDDRFASAEELRSELDRMRLAADHGEAFPSDALQKSKGSKSGLLLGAVVVVALAGAGAYAFLGPGGKTVDPATPDEPVSQTGPDQGTGTDDESFFTEPDEKVSEIDEEQKLRIIEADALFALNDIPRDLPREERIAALEQFILDHPGAPKVTGDAQTELESLRADIAKEAEAASQWEDALENSRVAWRTKASWPPAEGELPDPGKSLTGLRSLPMPPEHAGDDRYAQARTAFEVEIITASEAGLKTELAAIDQLEKSGDFEAMRPRLEALVPRFELPEPAADDPPELAGLRKLGDDVRARLADLEGAELRWREAYQREVRQKLAQTFGRGSGTGSALRKLDLETLGTQIAGMSDELGTSPAALEQLQLDHANITRALTNLVEAFDQGSWRRKAIQDPTGRGSTQKVVGISPTGITFERSPSKELAWGALRADPKWFVQLFKDRLQREYTDDEKRGVAALLRWMSVAAAVERSVVHLKSDRSATLSDAELAKIQGALTDLRGWIDDAGDSLAEERQRLDREQRALELLSGAIRAEQERSYALSVSRLEQLLFAYQDTLCVLLLSDGRAIPPAPEVQPASKNMTEDEKNTAAKGEKDDDSSSDPGDSENR